MYLHLIKDALVSWHRDKVPRLSASLSYYTLFSLAPFFLLVISLASVFFGESTIRVNILNQVSILLGPKGVEAVAALIEKDQPFSHNILISTIGVIFIFIGATGVFGQLKSSLDEIWHVEQKHEKSLLALIEHNFLPFTMMLGTGFLFLVSLILSAIIAAASGLLTGIVPFSYAVLEGINFVAAIVVITFLFAFIYKTLPDMKLRWSDVWSGAIVAATLFTIGKFLIGFYLGNSNVLSAYGAAGSVVVILIWVYYSAQILFFGAEYTKEYTKKYGSLSR